MTSRKNTFIILIIIVLAAGAWWYSNHTSYKLPIASGDAVASWAFQGARKGNAALEKQPTDEITRLGGLLGGDQSGANDDPTDYDLYVGIANQYDLLGDGAKEREYLEKALAIDSTKTGVAWHNLGALMNRLGAYNTARIAFAKAVEAQPQVSAYHLARIQFLMDHFASDISAVDGAFAEANTQFGDEVSILQLQAEWLEESNRPKEAIAALTKMKALMPAEQQATINAEITRLQSK
jgi:tetratricopeptide (TPR) repeat protein